MIQTDDRTKKNIAIACVYSESKEFPIDYLKVFINTFKDLGFPLICFTDYKGKKRMNDIEMIPLKYRQTWSTGWWSKMELFRPDVPYDIFFTDLDNIFLSPATLKEDFIDRLVDEFPSRPLMIKDLDYRQQRLQSAVMWIPHSSKEIVWRPFMDSPPEKAIKESGIYGDAKIIRQYLVKDKTCDTFQDVFGEDKIISYTFHWKKRKKDPVVVCFHGKHSKPHLFRKKNEPLVNKHFFGKLNEK